MSNPKTLETSTSKKLIPGDTFLSRAKNAIEIINRQLPDGGEITTEKGAADPRRATLKHPHIPGILASAFCRTKHTVVLIPGLGVELGVKKRDNSTNPFVHITTVGEAVVLGKKLAQTMKEVRKRLLKRLKTGQGI